MGLSCLQQDDLVSQGFVLTLETGDAFLHFAAFSIDSSLLLSQLVLVFFTQALHGLVHFTLHLLLLALVRKCTHGGLKFLQQILIIFFKSFTLRFHIINLRVQRIPFLLMISFQNGAFSLHPHLHFLQPLDLLIQLPHLSSMRSIQFLHATGIHAKLLGKSLLQLFQSSAGELVSLTSSCLLTVQLRPQQKVALLTLSV